MRRAAAFAAVAGLLLTFGAAAGVQPSVAPERATLPVTRVETVGFTVASMPRALDFYTRVLPFVKQSDVEVAGRPYELLSGIAGARSRVVRLALGDERIELTEFLASPGRPFPADFRSNDRAFQHVAMIVRDMDAAAARLRKAGVEPASTAPQRLPDWNPNAGGIRAYYFRDPDRHYLEILQFPDGKGLPKWHRDGPLFLGIDHTAIVVDDTDRALAFYRDLLGMRVAGESENYGVEQEGLNHVHAARLRITALRAADGPGIELLEYLAPRDGRAAPIDLHANDIAHWQTTVVAGDVAPALAAARAHRLSLVSPGPIDVRSDAFGFASGILVRDPDGHGVRIVKAAAQETAVRGGHRN